MKTNVLDELFSKLNQTHPTIIVFTNNQNEIIYSNMAITKNIVNSFDDDTIYYDYNTWMHSYSIEAMYTTRSSWEFSSKFNANFYVGYSAGFGAPQYNWNASISKSIKAVTLSLKGIDLLNQASRNLQRTATDEYIIDTYRNVLGRYFLFSVSFNFGKMNAKKSQAVQDATWNMVF